MRTRVTFQAITPALWPRGAARTPESGRRHGPFKATWATILNDLDTELVQIGAKDVVIQLDCPAVDIRQDGMPKGDARVRSPGIVLRFTHPKLGPVVYPCDAYADYYDNLRAISLTLNALRAIDRYQVGTPGQQYGGYRALPASTGETTLSPEQAADMLAQHSGLPAEAILGYPAVASAAVTKAMRVTHPDAGGKEGEFDLVKKAEAVLTEYHGRQQGD